ncbi:alpha-ketoglutarate-dependent dioxygenase alkB homolog 6-like [Clytia hemisphaerica]|uniref:Fe2OG dioxygenase domain-containing protein n=2 Tax=Clytia hemisphaerica TaxID=252671 RepID=A0A7M5XAW0_9CNID
MIEINYKDFFVPEIPSSAFYIPNFITKEEEANLVKNIQQAPKPKWTQLSNRRLQNWGGLPHEKGMIPEKVPPWLDVYFKKLYSMNIFDGKKPNHALVNEYLPGQGIMPHVDGPAFYPTISTINLGSHTLLDFYKPLAENEGEDISLSSRYVGSFLLEPRSLVCFKEDMYHHYLHGIEERTTDILSEKKILNKTDDMNLSETKTRKTRISVTIRHFPKILNIGLKFGRK